MTCRLPRYGTPFLLTVGLSACASAPPRFALRPPVTAAPDTAAVPVPHATEFEMLTYQSDLVVRRPIRSALYVPESKTAGDVNAMDDLPASTWFTPRLGYRDISPAELLAGPSKVGPPRPPMTVVRAKTTGGNPGFIIEDGRGKQYLVKFDPPAFPGVETTTALVVNRLYWAFGYNVPEDFLILFRRGDLIVDPESGLTESGVDSVLAATALPVEGQYRATVSLFIDGIILGAIPDKGVRKDDPNDRIPHEDRRILRALRVFGALTNHSGLRIDNTLDTYVGPANQGHVKHYLLDFGENFGAHGAGKDVLWDGYSRFFSFGEAFRRLVTLGLVVEDWEYLSFTEWKSVGAFEAQRFSPEKWKTVSPFLPVQRARPDDDYWAAKIVGALGREHVSTLVTAAQYPEPGAADYIIATLMERRRKILEYYLRAVSPVDAVSVTNRELRLRDSYTAFLGSSGPTAYEVSYRDDDGQAIATDQTVTSSDEEVTVQLPSDLFANSDGYVRIQVTVRWGDQRAPRAAEFHVRLNDAGVAQLVGVAH